MVLYCSGLVIRLGLGLLSPKEIHEVATFRIRVLKGDLSGHLLGTMKV